MLHYQRSEDGITEVVVADEIAVDDDHDIAIARDAYKEYTDGGCKSRPISELWGELDL